MNQIIDLRRSSGGRKQGLTFAAVGISWSSKVGHAYVIWEEEDDQARMSTSKAIGFYPKATLLYDVIFGGPGILKPDDERRAERKLTILVDRDDYEAAERERDSWNSDGTYQIGVSDCVDHIASIAHKLGLKVPDSTWIQPLQFMDDIIAAN